MRECIPLSPRASRRHRVSDPMTNTILNDQLTTECELICVVMNLRTFGQTCTLRLWS